MVLCGVGGPSRSAGRLGAADAAAGAAAACEASGAGHARRVRAVSGARGRGALLHVALHAAHGGRGHEPDGHLQFLRVDGHEEVTPQQQPLLRGEFRAGALASPRRASLRVLIRPPIVCCAGVHQRGQLARQDVALGAGDALRGLARASACLGGAAREAGRPLALPLDCIRCRRVCRAAGICRRVASRQPRGASRSQRSSPRPSLTRAPRRVAHSAVWSPPAAATRGLRCWHCAFRPRWAWD